MIYWWNNLGIKGKFYFWGFFFIGINLITYFIGFVMLRSLGLGIALLLIGFLLPKDIDY